MNKENSFYIKLLKKFNLEHYFIIFLTENKSLSNPYHNLYHTITVFVNTYHIALTEGLKEPEIRTLLISALFHDFNHSGGKTSDDKNVQEAINSFAKFSKESNETNNKIVEIIKATEYPYVIKTEDLILEQKIIRDADLTQMYTDNFLQQVIFGLLMGELKMTLKQAIEAQLKFMDSVHPFTKYGNELYDKFMQKRINDTIYINNLLNESSN